MVSLSIGAVSLDCHDHHQLATFYRALLGGEQLWSTPTSAGVRCGHHVLVMHHVDDYDAPSWPGSAILHLDLVGEADIEVLTRYAVTLGARVADHQPSRGWVVMLDPADHPFCITPFSPGV
ncbi:MAG: VOC family protein [Nakamurella sp.]